MLSSRRPLLILAAATSCAWSGTVTVCGNGCSTASLQQALDSLANCGDTIVIRSSETQTGNFRVTYRGCATQPITVTTDRADWLPPDGARVTPSHLQNLAILATPNSLPALQGVLDTAKRPPSGWVFTGLAFTSVPGNPLAYALVDLAGLAYSPVGPQELPENITFDRCYWFSAVPGSKSTNIQNMLRANGKNVTVKNSFFGDAAWPGIESHGIYMLEAPGPVAIRNNYVTASSIPIFSGGATPSYPVVATNITVEYNYTHRPWKWNGDPAQPFAEDYVANGAGVKRAGPYEISAISGSGVVTIPSEPPIFYASVVTITGANGCLAANRSGWRIRSLTSRTFQLLEFPGCESPYTGGGQATDYSYQPCLKNHGELKVADTVLWRYNVGENSWSQVACQGQQNGFTNTIRTELASSDGVRLGHVSLLDATHLRWTGTYRIGGAGEPTNDLGVCVSLPNTGIECHPVTSFSNDTQTLITATPFSAAPGGTHRWWISYTGSARLTNLTLTNNVWRNVSQGITFLGYSLANGAGDSGYGRNHMIQNNLWWNYSTYIDSQRLWLGTAGELAHIYGPTNYSFVHNTYFSVTPLRNGFLFFAGNGCQGCPQPLWERLTWSNNLMGPRSLQAPFGGDSVAGIVDTAAAYLSNSTIQNNAIPGATGISGCQGTNVCNGNIAGEWADPFVNSPQGNFRLFPGGKYTKAGTDERDLGADFDQLPLINSLRVTTSAHSAVLEFDVSPPIADVQATQPCVLEVSENRNLHSGLGVYDVIPDLDPILFRHADVSTRANSQLAPVSVSGNHVAWPLGRDDSGTPPRDDAPKERVRRRADQLQLTAGTAHYGRLMCYGDTRLFTFTTEPEGSSSFSAHLEVATNDGTTAVRALYYTDPSQKQKAEFPVGPTGATQLTIPVIRGTETLYQVEFLAGKKVAYRTRVEKLTTPVWPQLP